MHRAGGPALKCFRIDGIVTLAARSVLHRNGKALRLQFSESLTNLFAEGHASNRYFLFRAAARLTFASLVWPVSLRMVFNVASVRYCGIGFGRFSLRVLPCFLEILPSLSR